VARERPSTYLHTNTNTQPRGFGWRIHCGVEVTVLSTNKHHSLSVTHGLGWQIQCCVEATESSTNKQHHHVHQRRGLGPGAGPGPRQDICNDGTSTIVNLY
jgi:hypothetical protein